MAESHGSTTHAENCACARCTGFRPGHELSTRHGAYAVLQLKPRAAEITERLRELVPAYAPAHEAAIEAAGLVGAQFERAMAALLEADDASELRRLDQDARGWARLWLHSLASLGMTPMAQAKLGLDLTRAKGEAAAAYLAEKRAREQAEKDGADA